MENNFKVTKNLLAGLAAGLAIGLLLAPEKGTDTQDVLSDSFNKLGKSIKETAAGEIDNLIDLKDDILNAVKAIIMKAEKSLAADDIVHT